LRRCHPSFPLTRPLLAPPQRIAKSGDEEEEEDDAAAAVSGASASFRLSALEAERRALAASMLPNKKRKTYERVMSAVGHKQDRIANLQTKAAAAARKGDTGVGKTAGAPGAAAAAPAHPAPVVSKPAAAKPAAKGGKPAPTAAGKAAAAAAPAKASKGGRR
jgi:hypothetical protein